MNTRNIVFILSILACAGCRGTAPAKNSALSGDDAAVLLKGRLFLPSGEIRAGGMAINLESDKKTYRIPISPMEVTLYQVEPGTYRISPTRNVLGSPESDLSINFNGHHYRAPFPPELLNHHPVLVRPGKIVSLGVLEARVTLTPGSDRPAVSVALIDDAHTRRDIVQQTVKKATDPNVPADIRDNAVRWSLILDQTLIDLQEEKDDAPPPSISTP